MSKREYNMNALKGTNDAKNESLHTFEMNIRRKHKFFFILFFLKAGKA